MKSLTLIWGCRNSTGNFEQEIVYKLQDKNEINDNRSMDVYRNSTGDFERALTDIATTISPFGVVEDFFTPRYVYTINIKPTIV